MNLRMKMHWICWRINRFIVRQCRMIKYNLKNMKRCLLREIRLCLANNNMEGALDTMKLLNDVPALKRLGLEFNNTDFINELEEIEVVSDVEELALNGTCLDAICNLLFLQLSFTDLKLLSLRDYKLVGEMLFCSFTTLPKLEKPNLNDNDYDVFSDKNDIKMLELNYVSINANTLVETHT